MSATGSSPRLLAVDWWVAGYGLALAALWLPLAPASPTARWYLLLHLLLLLIPVTLPPAGSMPRRLRLLREVYPLVLLGVFWPELGAHYALLPGAAHDSAVAALDQTVFGVQPSLVWGLLAPAPWVRLMMEGAYLTYYVVLVGVPLSILRSGHGKARRELVLYATAAYLVCFLVYAVYPVVGPLHYFGASQHAAQATALQRADAAIRGAADSLGTAFPSSHVAGSFVLALLAARWCPQWVARACWVTAVLVCVAVIYTRHHYGVDVLAGLAVALFVHCGIRIGRASEVLRAAPQSRRTLPARDAASLA